MTNTNSNDVESTVNQIKKLEEAGCELVRMTVNTQEAAKNIKEIKKNCIIPLVADIYILITDLLFGYRKWH